MDMRELLDFNTIATPGEHPGGCYCYVDRQASTGDIFVGACYGLREQMSADVFSEIQQQCVAAGATAPAIERWKSIIKTREEIRSDVADNRLRANASWYTGLYYEHPANRVVQPLIDAYRDVLST